MGRGAGLIGGRILLAAFSERQARRQRGLSLVEVLVALAVLAIIITFPLLTIVGHRGRAEQVDHTSIAWQILANEAELQRHRPYHELRQGRQDPFLSLSSSSDLSSLGELLPEPSGTVDVEEEIGGIARVTMTLQWGENDRRRRVSLMILRADLPGGSLW